jgi:hypothetical protein
MSEHVAGMIADCEGKIATLTDIVEKLRWFQREFPHTAAAVVPVEKSRRQYTRRAGKAKKADKTNKQTKQGAGQPSAQEPP